MSTAQHKRLELKIRELESKLELEKTTKQRQETQISRQKEVNVVEHLDCVDGLGQVNIPAKCVSAIAKCLSSLSI